MKNVFEFLCALSFLVTAEAASWVATPFNPPAFPLAVRSPYLSAWLAQGSGYGCSRLFPVFVLTVALKVQL